MSFSTSARKGTAGSVPMFSPPEEGLLGHALVVLGTTRTGCGSSGAARRPASTIARSAWCSAAEAKPREAEVEGEEVARTADAQLDLVERHVEARLVSGWRVEQDGAGWPSAASASPVFTRAIFRSNT